MGEAGGVDQVRAEACGGDGGSGEGVGGEEGGFC